MFNKKNKWYVVFSFLFVLLSFVNIYNYLNTKTLTVSTPSLSEQEAFWTQKILLHPTYVDGHIELVKIKMAKGENDKARKLIRALRRKSPNSNEVQLYSVALGVD